MEQTPNYIRQLLMPTAKPPQGRKAWSIDLMSVWIPFFTATNVMGDTAIPLDALGCPLRLAYAPDGSVKFSRTGRPVIRVAKPIASQITLVRENFSVNLQHYAHTVSVDRAKEYKEQVKLAMAQGEPITQHDSLELAKAVKLQVELAMKEAEEKARAEIPQSEQVEQLPSQRQAVKV